MSNQLYLECYSGISGDMTVAALLDLGADEAVLKKAIESLPISGFKIAISRVKKAGLDVCDFDVKLDAEHENHDHDMNYLHGLEQHAHGEQHTHEVEEPCQHDHQQRGTDEKHCEHAHIHRGLTEIVEMIEQAEITTRAREIAIRIFTILAEAEAHAHGVDIQEVHFHEVGAVDSIVDIVSAAVCIDNLGITEVIVPSVSEGHGFVRCQHGTIPIPVPAVTAIVAQHGITLQPSEIEGELVTPTGAAIVAALMTSNRLPKRYTMERVGIGAGKRAYERPSLLRAMLIRERADNSDTIWKLESNIDDCSGEALGYVMEELFKAGARDVHYIPVYMKKNRPAYQLNVICTEDMIANLEEIIFKETTTIGIRRIEMERTVLTREIEEFQSSIGTAVVKVCRIQSLVRVYPEYSSVMELCKKNEIPYAEVYHLIQREYLHENKPGRDDR